MPAFAMALAIGAGMPAGAADEDASTGANAPAAAVDASVCENVTIQVRNRSGGAVKLISVDHAVARRWRRGPIVFATIPDRGDHTWTGSFDDLAGQQAQFRVNTRFIIDVATDRFSDLQSRVITTDACTSGETHEVVIGKPGGS
jgi:hypothetical protein